MVHLRALVAGVLLSMAFSVLASGQAAQPAGKLMIVDRPTITINPICNPGGEGKTTIRFRNDGAPVPFSPRPGDITSHSPAKSLPNATLTLSPDSGITKLANRQTAEIPATVKQVFEEGDFEAPLENEGVNLGVLRIVRSNPPFSISVEAANPDAPELTFTKGETAHFSLKNADPRAYDIAWEYSIDGQTVQSSAPVSIPAGNPKEVTFSPPAKWFPGWFTGLFKETVSDGYLTVSRMEAVCGGKPVASKTIKVKTHLAAWAPGIIKEALADATVFLLLALGGVFSLVLNFALPNQTRRLKIKEQLSAMGAQISNLSYALASRLRVLVGLELRLMEDKLRTLTWTNTDFSTEMQSITGGMTRLGTRLQFLAALGAVRVNFEKARSNNLPPSLMFAMEQTFDKIVEIGKKSDPTDVEVQTAQALIKKIQDQLDSGVQITAPALAAAVQRIKNYKTVFNPHSGRLGRTATFHDVHGQLPGPFDELRATDERAITVGSVSVDDFTDLDVLLFKLGMLRDYIQLVEGLPAGDPFRGEVVQRQPALTDFLGKGSWSAIYDSHLLLREMKDGNFKDEIESEIKAKRFRVDFDPQLVRRFQPIQFSLAFLKAALNDAPARDEWTCRWTFSRAGEDDLVEKGWEVTHYFQEAKTYSVTIALTYNLDGTEKPVPVDVERLPHGEISVSEVPRRSWRRVFHKLVCFQWTEAKNEWRQSRTGAGRILEFFRLLLALFIALLGLLAGAKEQLLKLDVLPALLAVFLIGFGADQVKNLLTQKPPGTDTNTAH